MRLTDFLRENNVAIVDRWTTSVLTSYSQEAKRIFSRQADQFANPVGANVSRGLKEFYKGFVDQEEPAANAAALEQLIRIRAVQDFAPSEALSFLFDLKQIVADEYQKAKDSTFDQGAWLEFTARLDAVILQAFDLYLGCRERLYQVRIDELKSGRHIMTDGASCPSALARRRGKNKEEKDSSEE